MKTISMKQLRQKFDPIRKGLARGESYLLMYRSKPLGIMRPYAVDTDAQYLGTGEMVASLPSASTPRALPDPQTISFGSKFNPNTKLGSAANPLDRLGVKKMFI